MREPHQPPQFGPLQARRRSRDDRARLHGSVGKRFSLARRRREGRALQQFDRHDGGEGLPLLSGGRLGQLRIEARVHLGQAGRRRSLHLGFALGRLCARRDGIARGTDRLLQIANRQGEGRQQQALAAGRRLVARSDDGRRRDHLFLDRQGSRSCRRRLRRLRLDDGRRARRTLPAAVQRRVQPRCAGRALHRHPPVPPPERIHNDAALQLPQRLYSLIPYSILQGDDYTPTCGPSIRARAICPPRSIATTPREA